jgi:hypothetical protein
VNGSLESVTDRPIFTVYPAYDPKKSANSQASEQAEAISTLVQILHNLSVTKK